MTTLWVSGGLVICLRRPDPALEMSLNAEPISGSIVDDFPDISLKPNPRSTHGRESLFIDGLDIVANRLFGPQPNTSTYICIWEIHVGRVKSCLSTPQANVVLAALKSFDSGFDDILDAPAREVSPPIDPDGEFLFARTCFHTSHRCSDIFEGFRRWFGPGLESWWCRASLLCSQGPEDRL